MAGRTTGWTKAAARTEAWARRLRVLRPIAPYLALFLVSLLVHWTYVLQAGRPFYVDTTLPLTYDDYAVRYFWAWNENTGHVNFASYMRVPYILPLYTLFKGLGIAAEHFTTFLFWLPTYLGMATSYAFFQRFLDNDRTRRGTRQLMVVCGLLAIIYGLSPWITKHYLHYYFRVSYAILPLAFLWFVRYNLHGRWRDLALTALAVLMLGMNPHFLVYFFMFVGLFALVDGLLGGRFVPAMWRTVVVVGAVIVVSLFWLLPFVYAAITGESVIGYNVGEFIVELYSRRSGPVNLFSMMAGFWPAVTERPWWLFDPLWVWQTVFLSIPIAAMAGFLATDRDDRFALFAGITIALFSALAVGYKYGGPVAQIYDLILQLPFHGVLRAPARLQAIIVLPLCYLMGRAALDSDRSLLRGGAIVLMAVACVGAVAMSTVVFTTALAPTELPDDHEHVEAAGYEDAFVTPPRPLSGYNPEWMFGREGGVVHSWDTHLYARPDTRQHSLNYYVLELIDRNRTATATALLGKSGANHIVVRTDSKDRRGVPPSEVLVDRLDDHLPRAYTGEHLVVFELDAQQPTARVVEPVPAGRNVHAAAPLANQSAVYPTFADNLTEDPLVEALNGSARFHPANTFRRTNELDALSRPATYEGVEIREERTIRPPDSDGSLVIHATPLNHGAEIVRETDEGREVFKFRDGFDRQRIDLDGSRRPLTLRGPVYVERLFIEDEPTTRSGTPVEASYHSSGTLTPNETELASTPGPDGLNLTYRVQEGGVFPQASFDVERPLDGPFTVNTSITARDGRDRFGFIFLPENGSAVMYPSHERLRPGRQNYSVHVPDILDGEIGRIQLAVFPTERPHQDQITVHEFDITARSTDRETVEPTAACRGAPAGPRCADAAEVTDVEQISPARYEVTVDADSPYALHFGESYDSLWVAEVEGEAGTAQYGAEPLYLATNGFTINETGTHTVTVRYRPQRWFEIGLVLSGLAVLLALAYVVGDWYRRRSGPLSTRVRRGIAAVRSRLSWVGREWP